MRLASTVDTIADEYVTAAAAADPLLATYVGIGGHDHRLKDLSWDGYAQREELTRSALAAMAAIEPRDAQERTARAAFLERLGVELDQLAAHAPQTRLSVVSSELHSIREVFDLMPTASPDDWANVSRRLAAIPAALGDYRATLLRGSDEGQVSAKRQIREVVSQIRSWTGQAGDGFFRTLVAGADVPESLHADLQRHAARAAVAYGQFGDFLQRDLLARGRDRDAAGREQYARDSRYFLGATIDLDETYAWGWQELHRIECCLAPTHDGGIYYTSPSEDFARPGRMWWSVPEGIDTFATWREVTTVYHEGVPGHHLQVGQTAYRSESLNRWQRLLCWVSGHGEGWALYAERLMEELGYLDDPGERLGMLDAQGFRAARVIVDIGMHLELAVPVDNPFGFHPGERWTPELGLEFMRQHCRMADAFIRFEVNRYLGWPGQAPSYKVGERIWRQARADAQRRHGAAFDLVAFHRAALDLGSLGLDPLREVLARL